MSKLLNIEPIESEVEVIQTKPDIEKVIGHITVDSGQVLLVTLLLIVDSKKKRYELGRTCKLVLEKQVL